MVCRIVGQFQRMEQDFDVFDTYIMLQLQLTELNIY